MFDAKTTEDLLKIHTLRFSHADELGDPTLVPWCSFRGLVERFIQDAFCYMKVRNDIVLPTCDVPLDDLPDGVYEVTAYGFEARFFMWHVPQFVNDDGSPLRRGVIVFLQDAITMVQVSEAYEQKAIYL